MDRNPRASRREPVRLLRPRLIDALRRNVTQRLSLVTAPAGSGTTTLLEQWRTVDGADGEILLIDAAELPEEVAGSIPIDGEVPRHTTPAARPWWEGWGQSERPAIIVIDHVDVLPDPIVEDIVRRVLEHSAGPRLVLAGRVAPVVSARGGAGVPPPLLGATDLWFDRNELLQLARLLGEPQPVGARIDEIETLTSGWPLAVTTVVIDTGWPTSAPPIELDRIGRPNCLGSMVPLVDELLDSPGDMEEIVERAAVFDSVDAARLTALLGRRDSVGVERMRALSLPAEPGLDPTHWSPLPLIAARAEERLRMRQPDLWRRTLQDVARCYAAEANFSPAIDCLVEARDDHALVAMAVDHFFDLAVSDDCRKLLEVLHDIPTEVKLKTPFGVICYGLLHRYVGDERGAQTVWAGLYADDVHEGRPVQDMSGIVAALIAIGIGSGRGVHEVVGAFDVAMNRFDVGRDGGRIDLALMDVADPTVLFDLPWHLDPTTIIGFLHAARAEAALYLSRWNEASEFIAQGYRLANQDPRTIGILESAEAAIAFLTDGLAQAEEIARRAADRLRNLSAVAPGIDPRLTLAEIALARGHPSEALSLASAAAEDSKAVSAITRTAQALLIETNAHLAAGEPRRGIRLLEAEADAALRVLPPTFEARRNRLKILLHVAAGDLLTGRGLVESRKLLTAADRFDALVALAIAEGDDRLLRMAVDSRAVSSVRSHRVVWMAVDAHLKYRTGAHAEAAERFRSVAELVGEDGFVQPILDIGVPLHDHLTALDDGSPELDRLRRILGDHRVPRRFGDVHLSEREQEVLEAIAGFVDDDELAERLGISPNTVRTHRRSLYRKLKVSSKAEAVRRAEQLGVLAFRPSRVAAR